MFRISFVALFTFLSYLPNVDGSGRNSIEDIEKPRRGKIKPENLEALNKVVQELQIKKSLKFLDVYKLMGKNAASFNYPFEMLVDKGSRLYNKNIGISKSGERPILEWGEDSLQQNDDSIESEKRISVPKKRPTIRRDLIFKKNKEDLSLKIDPLIIQLAPPIKREGPPRNAREQYEEFSKLIRKRKEVSPTVREEENLSFKRRFLNKVQEEKK